MPDLPPDPADWLAAAAARIEDDEDLLARLSDDDVARLLGGEDVRPAGVAAAIRRRLREAEAGDAAPRRAARPAWPTRAMRLASMVAGVAFVALMLWSLRPAPDASGVQAYRGDLAALAEAPAPKGGPAARPASDLRDGAAALLAAADARSRADALRAAERLARAAEDGQPRAAFLAALAYRLAGDDRAADAWLARVPPDDPYAGDASALR